ncbi:hypothetical protein EBU58_09255, partial [bacterium]|nr:hypothetical protein [bacterium]
MVTGRSPKIIRFDLLPESLTDVLGKALEESKNDRFQAAREFRDALKASLTAAEPAAADLGDGQCPSCGVKNEASRRFCRGCGESLEVPCLACDKPMPMWEEICGQCGGKQTPLVEQRRGELAVLQSEAESLLKEYRFEEAEQIVVALRDEPDPRLKQLVPWATEFLPQITKARDVALARAASLLQDSLKHEASHDYQSATSTLALIPEVLQQHSLPGCSETAAAVITRVLRKRDQIKQLEQLVNERIAQKKFDGLLAEVDKLVALRPDRADVRSLQAKLRNRESKILQQRDDAVQQAKQFLEAKEYGSVVAVLRKVDQKVLTKEVTALRTKAEDLQARLQSILQDINKARTEKQYDGLIDTVKEAIALGPEDVGLENFLASLESREEKVAKEIVERVTQSDDALMRCDYKTAFESLSVIPEHRRSEDVQERLDRVEHLGIARGLFYDAIRKLPHTRNLAKLEDVDLNQIARKGRAYLAAAAAHDIVDQPALDWCEKLEAAVEKQQAEEAAAAKAKENMRRALIAAGAVAAVVALLVIGLSIRSAWRASSLRAALAAKQWQQALEIDPTNVEAFLGLARDSLAANPPDVEGAFENANRAADAGADAAAVSAVRGQAHAQRAMLLTEAGKLVDAAADYLQAEQFGAADSVLAAAGAAIGKAWLIRGQAAVEKGDASGVSAAIEQAGKYQLVPEDAALLLLLQASNTFAA